MINVPKGLAPHEVDLYISAFKFCEKLIQEQNTDIGAAVTETTEKYSFIISDKELFAQFLFREITAYTEPSIGVVSPELDDKTWWSKLKKTEKFIPEYWQRYYDYLNRKPSWSLTAVQDIDSSTDEIMNALANPRSGRACDRMGMVFGYVQSGKTAHYIGLINKAVDAGYRIVVVLPLFLNAATVAKVLGVSPSSGYELMLVVAKSTPLHPAYMPGIRSAPLLLLSP